MTVQLTMRQLVLVLSLLTFLSGAMTYAVVTLTNPQFAGAEDAHTAATTKVKDAAVLKQLKKLNETVGNTKTGIDKLNASLGDDLHGGLRAYLIDIDDAARNTCRQLTNYPALNCGFPHAGR